MKYRPFDLLKSPLEGTNLIEASAGTGKTYVIAGLFLRLILEKDIPVNEILIVTFTVPATEELRTRIRGKLSEAIGAFSGEQIEDPFIKDLVENQKDPKSALLALKEAIRGFDQAAILTIHGFCRRILHEKAFESGSFFDTELVTEQDDLKREIVDDFWRRYFYNASPLFINYAIGKRFSPDCLFSIITRGYQPYLKIIPKAGIPDSSFHEEQFQKGFDRVRKAWQSARTDVENILATHEGLSRTSYGKAKIPAWIHAMDSMVLRSNSPLLFQGFEKFTSREIERAAKKGYTPPAHPFFDLCEKLKEKQIELSRVFDQRLLGLKVELFRYVQEELSLRKKDKNIQFFDDLLLKVDGALKGKGGESLAGSIRRKYRSALIDEFQDTDPIQYNIFKKIFGWEKGILFLIGDPKQAIYGFRGADIFTYMNASANVKSRYTLDRNWRSEPDLITAVNALFSRADRPFLYDDILFQRAVPGVRTDSETFRTDGKTEAPLRLWYLDSSKVRANGNLINKGRARDIIVEATANEISRLISMGRNKRAFIGNRPLSEGDIAVLVRRNDEARIMQKALSALHIPCVLYTTENLFDSHEALEMERLLGSIIEPNNEKLLKEALATDMMGVKGEEIDALTEDETGWERWFVKFQEYHDIWNERGFIQMFRYLLYKERILSRLMSFQDGERRSTNVLHLSEVLHHRSVNKRPGMGGLLKWLSEQRDPDTPRLEEHQLRLESDENAVKLVTVHKSKGLEYPVVFCPFSWSTSRIGKSNEPFIFHDEADNMTLTLDLGSPDINKNRICAEKEQLAENLRLLYVALTRGRSRCYLVWGRFKDAGASAPAYLFHQQGSWKQDDDINATEVWFKSLKDEDIKSELEMILDSSEGTIRLSEMPINAGEEYIPFSVEPEELNFRKFSGHIDRGWRISSFSSLVSTGIYSAELADHDTVVQHDLDSRKESEESPVEKEYSDIFSFPKGARAGTCFHDIFEHLDFRQKEASAIEKLVTDKLNQYGFDIAWLDAVCRMVHSVLSVQLYPDRNDFALSQIRNQDRLNELEFYFPLKSISPGQLNDIFKKYGNHEFSAEFPEVTEKLDFAPVRGFMKGFMDMAFRFQDRFYLVDWKSNFLGSKLEDYDQAALAVAMKEEFYIIQYHIYTVALHQYLKLRLPGYRYENHFGGVLYIFLRGVDPEKGSEFGIYRDRPSEEFIWELCACLVD